MPTKPLEALLYPELAIAEARELIELASPLLREVVNYSTNAFVRCASEKHGEKNEDLAVLYLYRHIIELTDAIEVLVSGACGDPAVPLLRSSFEGLLSLEYVAEDRGSYVERSLCWLAFYARGRIGGYEALVPTTRIGRQFAEDLRADKMVARLSLPPPEVAQAPIANLKHLLARDQFASVRKELEHHPKTEHWYSLFGGPGDLRRLAKHLKRPAQYDFLYKGWSAKVHGEDFSRFIDARGAGRSGIRRLRDPGMLSEVAFYAATFLLDATRLMLARFRPGEDLAPWYQREVREAYFKLAPSAQHDDRV
jgi:hypothetical protein